MSNVLFQASTSTPLGSSETYTSPWVDVSTFGSVVCSLRSDTHGHLYMEFSVDQINVDSSIEYECFPNIPEIHRLSVGRSWYRVRFVNDTVAQTAFRLQSIGGHQPILSAPLNLTLDQDADATLTRSLPAELDIMQDKLGGFSSVNKLGKNSNVPSGSVVQFVTEIGGTYTGFPISTAETIALSSSDANDTALGSGAREVIIQGLDENWELISEAVALNGTTPVNTVNTYRRAHTMRVSDSGNKTTASTINAGTITATHSTTTSNVFLNILPGVGSSNFAVYTIPAGMTGYLFQYQPQLRKGVSGSIDGAFWVRVLGGAPRYRRPFSASQDNSPDLRPYGGVPLPEMTDIAAVVTFSSTAGISVTMAFDLILINNVTPI